MATWKESFGLTAIAAVDDAQWKAKDWWGIGFTGRRYLIRDFLSVDHLGNKLLGQKHGMSCPTY
jgi:hypothetical protein